MACPPPAGRRGRSGSGVRGPPWRMRSAVESNNLKRAASESGDRDGSSGTMVRNSGSIWATSAAPDPRYPRIASGVTVRSRVRRAWTQGQYGRRAGILPAPAPEDADPSLTGHARQLVGEAALPDAGLPADEDQPAAARDGAVEPLEQRAQLALPPDEDRPGLLSIVHAVPLLLRSKHIDPPTAENARVRSQRPFLPTVRACGRTSRLPGRRPDEIGPPGAQAAGTPDREAHRGAGSAGNSQQRSVIEARGRRRGLAVAVAASSSLRPSPSARSRDQRPAPRPRPRVTRSPRRRPSSSGQPSTPSRRGRATRSSRRVRSSSAPVSAGTSPWPFRPTRC